MRLTARQLNRATLGRNPRLGPVWRTYDALSAERKAAITRDAADFLAELT